MAGSPRTRGSMRHWVEMGQKNQNGDDIVNS